MSACAGLYAESACVVVPLYDAVHACGYAVIAEAMAMGKPVITTRIAGRGDYIIEGETGFYVPPGDAAALRDRILNCSKIPRWPPHGPERPPLDRRKIYAGSLLRSRMAAVMSTCA